MTKIIEIKGLTKAYGGKKVLDQVSFSLETGKFYALLGKNGAGKSTLMKILMRYEQPDAGEGWIFGKSLDSDFDGFNLEIGYVSEALEYALPLKIGQLFSHFAGFYPKWSQSQFETVLKTLRIDLEKHFAELSRGQKMQVAFAAAIAIRPKILVLDEITAVLDANARQYFMQYLGGFVAEGGTVLMATNIVSEVQHFANHILLIEDGAMRLDMALSEAPMKFCKIRKKIDADHPVFRNDRCQQVGLNSDGSLSYLLPLEDAHRAGVSEDLTDQRGITAEDIFIYFTKERAR